MNKTEFLNILRQALGGEVSQDVIEQNISYYAGYISAQTMEDENRIIDELGDPRLIAKSIIEAEKAAKEKSRSNWSGSDYKSNASEQYEEYNGKSGELNQGIFFTRMKWYHKLIAIAVIIVLLILIAMIGRLLLSVVFVFGLPILLLLLVMTLFRRR